MSIPKKSRSPISRLTKPERLALANQAIQIIAAHGRKFFLKGTRVSRFELDQRGQVWFIDKYAEARIYTHYNGKWHGFSEGGTLRALVIALRNFISTGQPLPTCHLGPWPQWYSNGDPWGYTVEEMALVQQQVSVLGILTPREIPPPAETAGLSVALEIESANPR